MNRVDWHRAPICDNVGATDIYLPLLGVDLDLEIRPRDLGLWNTGVAAVPPFVLSALFDDCVGVGVAITQDVRVIDDDSP